MKIVIVSNLILMYCSVFCSIMFITEYIIFPRPRTALLWNWPSDVVRKDSTALPGMTTILDGFKMSFFESAKQPNTDFPMFFTGKGQRRTQESTGKGQRSPGMTKFRKGFDMSFFTSAAKQKNSPQENTCNQAYPSPILYGVGIEKKPHGELMDSPVFTVGFFKSPFCV